MHDEHLTPPRFCAWQTGSIYVRRCGRLAASQCAQCGLDLCDGHANTLDATPGLVYCPECHGASSGQGMGLSRGLGMQTYRNRQQPIDRGMDWGGDDVGDLAFADEDYAAFDALSDFDMNADSGDAYDS